MNIWHEIDEKRIRTEDFIAVIEIPKGSNKKYELDKETGLLILDRILFTSTHYPQNYGFIPRTLAEDHDPLDVLVICSEKLEPLSLVRCFPIGVMTMTDKGENDEKIIAIPYSDPNYRGYRDIDSLPHHLFEEMKHFFSVYKQLEHGGTCVDEVQGRDAAIKIIADCLDLYKKEFGSETEEK